MQLHFWGFWHGDKKVGRRKSHHIFSIPGVNIPPGGGGSLLTATGCLDFCTPAHKMILWARKKICSIFLIALSALQLIKSVREKNYIAVAGSNLKLTTNFVPIAAGQVCADRFI